MRADRIGHPGLAATFDDCQGPPVPGFARNFFRASRGSPRASALAGPGPVAHTGLAPARGSAAAQRPVRDWVGPMVKLLVLLLLVPFYLRFRFRRDARIRGRILPWSGLIAAILFLLVTPWNRLSSPTGTAILTTKAAIALGLLAYLVYDVQRALRQPAPAPRARRGGGR